MGVAVGPRRYRGGVTYRSSGPPGRTALRVDPVLLEAVVGVAWLTVGTLGLGADGVGTLVLAVGLAAVAFVLVENRRRGPRVFDAARSRDALRHTVGAVVVVVVASVLFGLVGASAYLPGLALVVTGGALLLLSRSTGESPTVWLGFALVALGVLSAFVSTQTATGFFSQGVLGIVAGIGLLVSAADRIGLLTMLRDRAR